MSSRRIPVGVFSSQPQRPTPELVKRQPRPASTTALQVGFWGIGLLLASAQAWIFRYQVTADSISYLDVSDGVFPGSDWHRLINGVWSPLYPFLLGVFRRIFKVPPANEIVAGHLLNIVFFLFAFICFEFCLRVAIRKIPARDEHSGEQGSPVAISTRAYLSLGYALFLWASISGISLRSLRADMLMSSFVFLTAGMLLRMQNNAARWKDYIALGAIFGLGFLAKAVFLPIGCLMLAASLFAVEDRRRALTKCAAALAIFILIGSVYFVPLSLARGTFTLGESGKFNYLVHVDRVRPTWYFQNLGSARGSFTHPVEKVSSAPPAYAFSWPSLVTHPLRIDPSAWVAGARPHFDVKRQLSACLNGLLYLVELQVQQLALVLIAALALALLAWKAGRLSRLKATWPIWILGLVGYMAYVPVHIEVRYVAAFIALFWFGIILGVRGSVPVGRKVVMFCTVLVVASLLVPPMSQIYGKRDNMSRPNEDAEAAVELAKLGVGPGDKVARISPSVMDLGIERIARVEITAEVGIGDSDKFWTSPPDTQEAILNLFAARGARAVIATRVEQIFEVRPGWTRLGSTQYWVSLPKPSH